MNRSEVLERAIKVFARGFSCTRSFAHPYVVSRRGRAWVLRDAPRAGGKVRNEEWIVTGLSAEKTDQLVRRHACGRFVVSSILATGEVDDTLRADFKKLGYRLVTTEGMMVRKRARLPKVDSPAVILRVTTQAMAAELTRTARQRLIRPEDLTIKPARARIRVYVAQADGRIVGWVRSVVVGDATWVASMYVMPAMRRRGVGKAMLREMLRDDRAAGAVQSVLLASHAGAKLYPVMGYRTIGTLYLFTPRRR